MAAQYTIRQLAFGISVGLMLSVLLFFPSVGFAQANTWTRKADLSTTKKGFIATAVADGRIYVIGGWNHNLGGTFQTVEEYDPATDTWTQKADLSVPIHAVCTCTVNGKIYVVGGSESVQLADPVSTVQMYNPARDTWTLKADMPAPRGDLACVAIDEKIYAIGGSIRVSPTVDLVSTVEVYDTVTDTWTRKADMTAARTGLRAAEVNGKIYVVGGLDSGRNVLNVVEEYDPAMDTWTRKADMPTARWSLSAVAVNRKIYAIGGSPFPPWSGRLATMEVYDPQTDTWTKGVDMPTPRLGLAASTVDSRIYAIGGFDGQSFVYLTTVEEFDTGFRDPSVVSVNPQGKLATMWATIKQER